MLTDTAFANAMRETPMPAAMQALLGQYPRKDWAQHPNFAEPTQNWLSAHQMFRQLSAILINEVQGYIDQNKQGAEFAARLGYFGDLLVQSLHGHHNWEDKAFFPELAAVEPRFEEGLEILEGDHRVLNATLDVFVEDANRVIKLIQLDEEQARETAEKLRDTTGQIAKLLDRHLSDEEELAVPIILHHKLRG